MSPREVADRLAALAGGIPGSAYGVAEVTVPAQRWVPAAVAGRDDPHLSLDWFDLLAGADLLEAGFAVAVHLGSTRYPHHALLRTVVAREQPRLATLTGVFAGAAWPERETFEMYGVVFDGHPDLRRLLLPDDVTGHPLRKDFALAARIDTPWPGAKQPGGAPAGRAPRPYGVPALEPPR